MEPHRYTDVLDATIEDDADIVDNMGAAAIGGLLFGGAGAIVGSSRRKKTCSKLLVRVIMRNESNPCLTVSFIDYEIACKGDEFASALENVKKCVSKFNLIASANKEHLERREGDYGKLRELKALLDDGIITSEDFEAAKKRALGI